MPEPTTPTPAEHRPPRRLRFGIGGLAVAAVVLGILPQAFAGFAEMSTLVAAGQ